MFHFFLSPDLDDFQRSSERGGHADKAGLAVIDLPFQIGRVEAVISRAQ